MAEKMKLFSPEWCEAAREAVNASQAMYEGFKDPDSFTNRMEFGVAGRDDLRSHLEWEKAKVTAWVPPEYPEDDIWLRIQADIDTFRKAAEGEAEGGNLLMAGKIKFAKGPMSAAIENGGAFNNFLLAWGQVPTDWDV